MSKVVPVFCYRRQGLRKLRILWDPRGGRGLLLCEFLRLGFSSLVSCPHSGKLRTHEHDGRGVVHPEEQDDDRAGSAVAGGRAALAEVESDQFLADTEQDGGGETAD